MYDSYLRSQSELLAIHVTQVIKEIGMEESIKLCREDTWYPISWRILASPPNVSIPMVTRVYLEKGMPAEIESRIEDALYPPLRDRGVRIYKIQKEVALDVDNKILRY